MSNFAVALASPFVALWVAPKVTIRRIASSNPREGVIALVVVATELGVLDGILRGPPVSFKIGSAPIHAVTPYHWLLFSLAMLLGAPLFAIAMLYVDGALVAWVGRLIGGVARAVEIRAAIAWSRLPNIASGVIFALAAEAGLVSPLVPPDRPRMLWHFFFQSSMQLGGILALLLFWSIAIELACIAELHRFSIWRAIAARVIAFSALIGAVLGLVVLLGVGLLVLLGVGSHLVFRH